MAGAEISRELSPARVEILAQDLPIQCAARTGQPVRNCDVTVVLENGTAIDLLGNVEPMLGDNGRPQGAVGVLSDITEQKRAEATLRQSRDEIAHLNRVAAMSELATSLAHELQPASGRHSP